jgi:hypothetical protein
MHPPAPTRCPLHVCPPANLLYVFADLIVVTDDERETYTRVIDSILAEADLATITRKKIRQGLEDAVNRDLSDQKVRIAYLYSCRPDY